MNLNNVDFMIPIIYDNPDTFGKKLGNTIENSLFLGGARAHVIPTNNSLANITEDSIPPWKTALKIVIFIASAGLIPLALLAAKAVYRNSLSNNTTNSTPIESKKVLSEITQLENIGKNLQTNGSLTEKNRVKVKHNGNKYLLSVNNDKEIKIQRVVKKLGRGGFGKVTELHDIKTNQHTALKIATPPKPSKHNVYPLKGLQSAERDLNKEVENVKYLNENGDAIGIQKPAMTSVFTVEKQYPSRSKTRIAYEGIIYDGSLNTLRVHQLPLKTRLEIVHQIVKGVQLYRQKGMVHSDLKPANIFYKKEDVNYSVYVADFGGAYKESDQQNLAFTEKYVTKNDLNEITGSFTQQGKFYSAKKLDIYSLGITINELLFGVVPEKSGNSKKIMEKSLFQMGLNPEKVTHFITILNRMTIKDIDNPIKDGISNLFGLSNTRPTIKEIVDAVEGIVQS